MMVGLKLKMVVPKWVEFQGERVIKSPHGLVWLIIIVNASTENYVISMHYQIFETSPR